MDISTRLELAKVFSEVSDQLREESEDQVDVVGLTVSLAFMRVSMAITKGGL